MSLVLYHAWASTCSQKVRLALAEKGLLWKGVVINLRAFEHLTPGFLAVNPDAQVPVLDHDGFVVRESSIINEYLDELFPHPPLMLADANGRSRVRMWSRFIDDVTSPAIKRPSFEANLRPYLRTLPPERIDDALGRMPCRATRERWRQAAGQGFTADELARSHADLRRTLARIEAALVVSPWLAGDAYTLADVDMAPFVARIDTLPGYHVSRDWPRAGDWLKRLRARPAYALARLVEQRPVPLPQPD